MNNLGFIASPDLRAILDQQGDNILSGTNCIRIGEIQSYDPATQSAAIQIVNSVAIFNSPPTKGAVPASPQIVKIPVLVKVPVWILSGGGAYFSMPITPGDFAIVFFNDRDLDPWWSNSTMGAPPATNRMHSLADGIALVGIRPATNPIANQPTDGQHMSMGNANTTMINMLDVMLLAMTALNNVKTGGDASSQISLARSLVNDLFQ